MLLNERQVQLKGLYGYRGTHRLPEFALGCMVKLLTFYTSLRCQETSMEGIWMIDHKSRTSQDFSERG